MAQSVIEGPQRSLRVMTFNIWLSGERVKNGLQKIADQINAVDPDIVTIQVPSNLIVFFILFKELQTAEIGKNLTDLLGASKWKLIHHQFAKYPDTAIVTKHKVKYYRNNKNKKNLILKFSVYF